MNKIEEKILRYFKDGKLVNFPSKRNLQVEILKKMKEWFKPGIVYSEKEINEIIKNKIECRDHITIRRDLVDLGILIREDNGSKYWVKLIPRKE
ncbi:DUF2087 domain-containing protein [Pseudomonadota bacterium]